MLSSNDNLLCCNVVRITLVILGPCTDILREILRREISPQNLSHTVNVTLPTLRRNPFNKIQELFIFPKPNSFYNGNYSDFDITLLYTLLRNFCSKIRPHKNKWGNNPDHTDKGVAANIERIRLFRNEHCGHQVNISISDQDFERAWRNIFQVILELEGHLGTSYQHQENAMAIKNRFIDQQLDVEGKKNVNSLNLCPC